MGTRNMALSTSILMREEAKAGYTQYVVEVRQDGAHTYTVKRRYKQFMDMYVSAKDAIRDLPTMPPKSFWRRRLCKSFLDDRQKQLNDVLFAIVKGCTTVGHPELLGDFLANDGDDEATDDGRIPSTGQRSGPQPDVFDIASHRESLWSARDSEFGISERQLRELFQPQAPSRASSQSTDKAERKQRWYTLRGTSIGFLPRACSECRVAARCPRRRHQSLVTSEGRLTQS